MNHSAYRSTQAMGCELNAITAYVSDLDDACEPPAGGSEG